jgi:chromate transport protein ChrA
VTDSGTFTIAAVLAAAGDFPMWTVIALAVVAGFLFLRNVRPPAGPQ